MFSCETFFYFSCRSLPSQISLHPENSLTTFPTTTSPVTFFASPVDPSNLTSQPSPTNLSLTWATHNLLSLLQFTPWILSVLPWITQLNPHSQSSSQRLLRLSCGSYPQS
ncbi:hypothetical protein L596_016940 [Steinernema carpocapsae]|uniref:Uncharacterized protein n=1 Tax=Steinernema carpocapsae TaxID=34508 RepID=A0A4V6A1I2_STECR|nr:hypothetical protein L596_016940 [Steinernema carpocapsae]